MLCAAVVGLTEEEARWKPVSGAWSVLEVVCHITDEEVDDFGPRVFGTLDDPRSAWAPIDPEGVATSRGYNEQDLAAVLNRFEKQRDASVMRLRALSQPAWSNAYEHPQFGPIRAGDVMVSWAAHDMLHLRQISKRRFELISRAGDGFGTAYAGDW